LNFPQRSYPAKVLLFGEHTVVLGGDALAIPFSKYKCHWDTSNMHIEFWWQDFIDYLKLECLDFLLVERLDGIRDVTPLTWDIPIGYGLGSSGAITAAIYDYANVAVEEDYGQLQALLGKMESYFHGKSSGYDPLISFAKTGVHKSGSNRSSWSYDLGDQLHCYLLDSGTPRSGKDLIQEFGKRAEANPQVHQDILKLNNQIIQSIVGDASKLDFEKLNQLSHMQYEYMDYMLVDSVNKVWEESLSNDEVAIKICGAGGGGFYLVLSQSPLDSLGSFNLTKVE